MSRKALVPVSIGSLFAGIGGLELGLEWAGLGPTIWQVEQDARCRRVLARHWPEADRSVEDVRHAGVESLDRVDIVVGGFPCQDVSGAGGGAGLAGARSGLWWEFHRVVGELQPPVVVVENVASGARRWVCAVRRTLQELGYRTRALGVAARDAGAPHRRARIFVVAYSERVELRVQPGGSGRPGGTAAAEPGGSGEGLADTDGERLHWRSGLLPAAGPGRRFSAERDHAWGPPEPCLGGGPDGLPGGVDGSPGRWRWPAGRDEDQHAWEPPRTAREVRDRAARLRALGNAVVPQCAYVVGLVVRRDLGLT